MNLLNTIKSTKNITLAAVFSLGAVFAANAAPAPAPAPIVEELNQVQMELSQSLESTISAFLVAQGREVAANLSAELEQSIASSFDQFSIDLFIDESLAWLTSDEMTGTSTTGTQAIEETEQDSDCKDTL